MDLLSLWLPVLVSTVGVFFASSVIWMALPIHKNDYKSLGEREGAVLDAVRSWSLAPGLFYFPHCDPKTLKDNPVAQERLKTGPWGMVLVMPGPVNMGKTLALWALNLLIVSTLIAYIASIGLNPASATSEVVRLTATLAFMTYGGSLLCDCIWKGKPWSTLPAALFDVVVYAVITAAAFALLWPAPAAPKLPL